jgi:signal transduction histidine kinase/ActR/RegA family two-component response regulator
MPIRKKMRSYFAHDWGVISPQTVTLAVLYFIFGHLAFLISVSNGIVTPVFFAPEGIALAASILVGPRVWLGVFLGQLALALSRNLPWEPVVIISAINGLEAALGGLLFYRLGLNASLSRVRDWVGLQVLIFFVLQACTATLAMSVLWGFGVIPNAAGFISSWQNGWIGNCMGQSQLVPLLLALATSDKPKADKLKDFVLPILLLLPSLLVLFHLFDTKGLAFPFSTISALLILLAIYRNLVAVTVGGVALTIIILYVSNREFGPFVADSGPDVVSLNIFILGTTLIAQFVAVLQAERDRLVSDISKAKQKIEEASLAKSRFFAAAGHDLRQPLAATNMFIGTLKLTRPTPNQRKIIANLEAAMSNFSNLLDTLLNISRLESGTIKPEYRPTATDDIAEWLMQSFAPIAEKSGLAFKLRFPSENLFLRSDVSLVRQILSNLVSNAIKYTSKGTIRVSARRRGTNVLFQVLDTGIGIEADQFENIFEDFYQVNNPQCNSENGLGLGLSIVKRALALLDAEIIYRSRPGRGTVFGFSLPQTSSGQTLQTVPTCDPEDKDMFAQGKHFLVLENDELVAQGISSFLQAMGGNVNLFHSAEDALRNPDTENTDYYICDYRLDGPLSGLQFLNQLRQQWGKPVNAVLMSGDTSIAFFREIENCEWPVLSKPVNAASLVSCLNVQSRTLPKMGIE